MEQGQQEKRVLIVGLDPAVVDYGRMPVPGLTRESLTRALDAAEAELENMGHQVRMLYIDTGETAEAVVRQALERDRYDCIMIGAGVRVPSDHFLLFERLINVVHRHAAPTVRICFNTRPDDSVAAVLRWL
ncbi:MAG: hypothetical protein KIS73_06890 [Enhydrobacter sp.]|nr:hypothetical protein [Enhydrobacter sp.]